VVVVVVPLSSSMYNSEAVDHTGVSPMYFVDQYVVLPRKDRLPTELPLSQRNMADAPSSIL